jgi:hypothetical protein
MCADLGDGSILDDADAIRLSDRRESMGNEENRLIRWKTSEILEHLSLCFSVDCACRLIEYVDIRITIKYTRKCEFLPLTDRWLYTTSKLSTELLVESFRVRFDESFCF